MPAKILIVDDESSLERLILQRFRKKVRSGEYEFVFAENGIEALNKLDSHEDLEIILTDINMPQMDGLTFISKLNDEENNRKVVMVSAYGNMQNIRAAMNHGAYDFVVKPIDFKDLEITIERARKEVEMLKLAERAKLELFHLQQELSIASEIQQSILPTDFDIFSEGSPYSISASMEAAKEVGGDFYDYFFIDEDHLAFLIGDVSGKGMPAALFMAVCRTLLKATGLKDKNLAHCLEQVNYLLNQDNAACMFVTVFYAVLNLKTGLLEYVSAGHNAPILVKQKGDYRLLDDAQNVALGILPKYQFKLGSLNLEQGDMLLLYTDGISEATNIAGEFYGEDKLLQFFLENKDSDPAAFVQKLKEEINSFSYGIPASDDRTSFLLRAL